MGVVWSCIAAHSLSHPSSYITFHTDNSAVVDILNKQSSKCSLIMSVIRPLVLLLLTNNLHLSAIHIPGIDNILCDAISRKQATKTLLKKFGMHSQPCHIPAHLLPENFNSQQESSSLHLYHQLLQPHMPERGPHSSHLWTLPYTNRLHYQSEQNKYYFTLPIYTTLYSNIQPSVLDMRPQSYNTHSFLIGRATQLSQEY